MTHSAGRAPRFLAALATVVAVAVGAAAAGQHPSLVDPAKTRCTTCHDDLLAKKVVHPATEDCLACHEFGKRDTTTVVSLSAQGLFLFALSQPEWSDEQPVLAGNCDGSVPTQCEGQALFGSQALAGETIIAISPGLALKLEL